MDNQGQNFTLVPNDAKRSSEEDQSGPVIAQKPKARKFNKLKLKNLHFGNAEGSLNSVPSDPIREKTLRFILPSGSTLGTPEEASDVCDFASRLSVNNRIGNVARFGIRGGLWQIDLTLHHANDLDDEQLVMRATSELQPTVRGLPKLCTGFRAGSRSRWEFRVSGFVLADGSL